MAYTLRLNVTAPGVNRTAAISSASTLGVAATIERSRAVAITSAGGLVATPTPPAGSASVAISSQSFPANGSGEIPVGAAVHFDTSSISGFDTTDQPTADYNPGRVDLTARWDFGDTGTWDKPGLMVAEHKQRTLAMGHSVTHAWDTPGTKTVSVEVRDASGNSGTDSVNVTVVSLENYVPLANRIVVATDSDYTGMIAHNGGNEYTTMNAAVAASKSINGIKGIFLKGGQTFNWTDSSTRFRAQWPSTDPMVIATSGGTGRAVLKWPGSTNGWWIDGDTSMTGILVHGVEMASDWNPVTLKAEPEEDMGIFYPNYPGHISVYDSIIRNYGLGIYHGEGNGTQGPRASFIDSEIKDYRAYAVYGEVVTGADRGGRFSSAGSFWHQSQDAAQSATGAGNEMRNPDNWHDEINLHGVRIGEKYVNFRGCQIFGNNGWSAINGNVGYTAIQTMRINTGGVAGCRIDLWGNTIENGDRNLYAEYASSGGSNQQVTAVIDGNTFLMTAYGNANTIQTAQSGWCVRNCLFIRPNVPVVPASYQSGQAWVSNVSGGSGAGAPVEVYSNTLVDLQDTSANTTNELRGVLNNIPAGSFVGNNIQHSPAKATPVNADAPLDSTPGSEVPLFLGIRTGFRVHDQDYGSVANGASITVPYPTGFSQADFIGANAPERGEGVYVKNAGNLWHERGGGCVFTYGASNVSVQNTSATTWTGELRVFLNASATDSRAKVILSGGGEIGTDYATPTNSLAPFTPQTGSAAIGDADKTGSDKWALTDIRGTWRASVLSGLSRSVESRGAWEPAIES